MASRQTANHEAACCTCCCTGLPQLHQLASLRTALTCTVISRYTGRPRNSSICFRAAVPSSRLARPPAPSRMGIWLSRSTRISALRVRRAGVQNRSDQLRHAAWQQRETQIKAHTRLVAHAERPPATGWYNTKLLQALQPAPLLHAANEPCIRLHHLFLLTSCQLANTQH